MAKKVRVCEAPGCQRTARTHGLCDKHHLSLPWRGPGDLRPKCSVDGCGQAAGGGDLCGRHRASLPWRGPSDHRPRCSVADCPGPATHGDLCNRHHKSLPWRGENDHRPKCSVVECEGAATSGDLCTKHHMSLPWRGENDHRQRCPVTGCAGAVAYRGLCGAHAQRAKAYSLSVSDLGLADQNVCAVCGRGDDLHIDHDHESEAIRGVLCGGCNRALGLLAEDYDRMIGLAFYGVTPPELEPLRRAAKASPIPVDEARKGVCVVAGCGGAAHVRDLCKAHYGRAQKYSLSPEELALIDRHGACAVCGSKDRLCVDHNHASGRARGILCHNCNAAFGLVGEDGGRLIALAHYLLDPPGLKEQKNENGNAGGSATMEGS